MTKTELILSKPNMSAAEVIQMAAKDGITISRALVHVVRMRQRRRGGAPPRPRGRPRNDASVARGAQVLPGVDPIRRCVEQFTRELLPLLRAEAARAVGEALR